MRINIVLTKEDLEKGIANNCFKCPVARALERALTAIGFSFWRVGITPWTAGICTNSMTPGLYSHSAEMPKTGEDFVDTFDMHGYDKEFIAPIEFMLEFKQLEETRSLT